MGASYRPGVGLGLHLRATHVAVWVRQGAAQAATCPSQRSGSPCDSYKGRGTLRVVNQSQL